MTKATRRKCRVCGRYVLVNKSGRFIMHPMVPGGVRDCFGVDEFSRKSQERSK